MNTSVTIAKKNLKNWSLLVTKGKLNALNAKVQTSEKK